MFSHVLIGITDFERAMSFYAPLMEALGIQQRFCDPARPWAGWQSSPAPRPLFVIAKPYDGNASNPGNGPMVAFMASTRQQVERCYNVALAHGGLSEGAPGLRPQYHENYHGAYFRDPDGNKLCVVCHEPEEPQ